MKRKQNKPYSISSLYGVLGEQLSYGLWNRMWSEFENKLNNDLTYMIWKKISEYEYEKT